MAEFIKVNETDYVHLSSIKRISEVSETERDSLARLGEHVNAARFNTRIDEASGGKFYATETIDQLAAQGIALVEIGRGACVPRDNISKTRNLTSLDRKEFEERTGRPMAADFKSQIETRAGRVLSTSDSATIMRLIGQSRAPQISRSQTNGDPGAQSMADERSAVMAKAAPNQSQKGNSRSQTQQLER